MFIMTLLSYRQSHHSIFYQEPKNMEPEDKMMMSITMRKAQLTANYFASDEEENMPGSSNSTPGTETKEVGKRIHIHHVSRLSDRLCVVNLMITANAEISRHLMWRTFSNFPGCFVDSREENYTKSKRW